MTLYLFFSLDSVDFNGEWITGMKVYEYRVQLILYGFFSKLQQFMYTIIFNGVWRKMYTFSSILSTIIQVANIQTAALMLASDVAYLEATLSKNSFYPILTDKCLRTNAHLEVCVH